MLRTVSFLLALALTSRAAAEPKEPTSLSDGTKKADAIVVAQVAGHQYQEIASGESITVDPHQVWLVYRIVKRIKESRDPRELQPGQTIRVQNVSTECERPRTTVTRNRGTLVQVHRWANLTKREVTTLRQLQQKLRSQFPRPVVLFLERSGRGYQHVGWGLSLQPWTSSLERKIVVQLERLQIKPSRDTSGDKAAVKQQPRKVE